MDEEQGIRRVSWLPKKLDQQIEDIRKKIGYTRSGFYRYALTRLVEQTLLSKPTETYLDAWQEITGILETAERNNQTTTITISCAKDHKIILPTNTPQTTLQQLQKLQGQKIAILRTDNPDRPIIIRTYTATPDANKTYLQLLELPRSILFVAFKWVALKFSLWLSRSRLRRCF